MRKKPPSDEGGAPRSEFEILMIASGDHTTIHRWHGLCRAGGRERVRIMLIPVQRANFSVFSPSVSFADSPAGPAPLLSASRTFSPLAGKSTLVRGSLTVQCHTLSRNIVMNTPKGSICNRPQRDKTLTVFPAPAAPVPWWADPTG